MATADTTPSLNKWYVTSPQSEVRWNAFCHVGLKTLAIITCIAAAALAASVIVFSFLAASGTSMPIGLAVASFTSIPLTHLASFLWNKSEKYFAIEQQERRVKQWQTLLSKDYLKQDRTLNFEKINNDLLFQQFDISAQKNTLSKIQQALPQENASEQQASKAWIRVAARFMYELEITRKTLPEMPVLDKNSPIERERAILRKHNYKEMHIFPHTLTTVMLSVILKSPFILATHLSDLGSLNIKSKILRKDDRKQFHQDNYFTLKAKNATPIPAQGNLKDIARGLTAVGLPEQSSNSVQAERGKGFFQNPDHIEFVQISRRNFSSDFAKKLQELKTMLFQQPVELEETF